MGNRPALVLDIETVPQARAMEAAYPEALRQPPSNYKSDEAIQRWREADRQKWSDERAKECSLNPRLGRVLCVSFAPTQTGTDGEAPTTVISLAEEHEPEVLRRVWAELAEYAGRVVTWNGSWDLRFLLIRSLAHGLTPTLPPSTIREWFRKYTTFPHFDCKAVLCNWEPPRAGDGLSEWAGFLGLAGKTEGLSGADVYPLYLGAQLDEIAEYCAQDVTATRAVFERISPFFH